MKVRWTGEGDREVMVHLDDGSVAQVDATRLEWVDLPASVLGKRPAEHPGRDDFDPGHGLLAQGDWDGTTFRPLWEIHAVKKAQRTRAQNEAGE